MSMTASPWRIERSPPWDFAAANLPTTRSRRHADRQLLPTRPLPGEDAGRDEGLFGLGHPADPSGNEARVDRRVHVDLVVVQEQPLPGPCRYELRDPIEYLPVRLEQPELVRHEAEVEGFRERRTAEVVTAQGVGVTQATRQDRGPDG